MFIPAISSAFPRLILLFAYKLNAMFILFGLIFSNFTDSMVISGKVKYISQDIKVSDSFTKRELVVTTDEQYPQHILINFVQDKCDLIDKLIFGDNVKVSINLRGREWVNPQGESKYFNDIQGWRVEKL